MSVNRKLGEKWNNENQMKNNHSGDLETETSSIYCDQLSRFHLKTGTESSL
jgi:hypothetical protein